MANTLFDHGKGYHFHGTNVNFTRNHAVMRQTQHDRTKPSKLELLQEDYRSRLLHEKEQKVNAMFEQKIRADLLPKKGSVREFFLNRRMLASTTTSSGANNGVNLPPIKSNSRYKGKQTDKLKNLVEKQRVSKRKEKERAEVISFLKDMEEDDSNMSDLGKLREKYRKSKTESFPAKNIAVESVSSNFSTAYDQQEITRDAKNASLNRVRKPKSKEVCRRGRKPSQETNKERNTKTNDEERESSFNENIKTRARGVKSRQVCKRGRKPSEERNNEMITNAHANTNANMHANTNTSRENLATSFTEHEVSKSLVKIKELVNRRKTEELITRSKMARLRTEGDSASPKKTSQSFDKMCKAETELRETISRERKKLSALQERRRQKDAAKTNHLKQESFKEIGGKQGQSRKAEQNAQLQGKDKKTNNVKKYERNRDQEASKEQHEIQYETKERVNSSRNVNQQMAIKKPQTTQSTEIKFNEGNYSSSADAKIDLVTCSNCGRSFMRERLAKHEKACKKASSRVKKPFDAKRKRAEGTDMEKYIIIGKDTADDSTYKEKKRNWRKTHENFIQSIRSARRQEHQPATPMTNPDYVECSYCKRKFKQTVAERHIPRCKDIKARPRPPRR